MPFNKEAVSNEAEFRIELIFKSGRPVWDSGLPMPPSACIAMSSFCSDEKGRPMITTAETLFGALQAQVEFIKALLDARLAEAKASFPRASSN
jgi:hypothetical protein